MCRGGPHYERNSQEQKTAKGQTLSSQEMVLSQAEIEQLKAMLQAPPPPPSSAVALVLGKDEDDVMASLF